MTESASLFERVKQKLVRLLPDSIFGQILFVLVAGLALLQIANFLVVCGVQKLYVDPMERARIEHVVSYRALFESIPADLRAETLNAAHGNPALAQSLERVTIVRERPDWAAPGPILADSLGALKEALSAAAKRPTCSCGAKVPSLFFRFTPRPWRWRWRSRTAPGSRSSFPSRRTTV